MKCRSPVADCPGLFQWLTADFKLRLLFNKVLVNFSANATVCLFIDAFF